MKIQLKERIMNMHAPQRLTFLLTVSVCVILIFSIVISEIAHSTVHGKTDIPEALAKLEQQDPAENAKAIKLQRVEEVIARAEEQVQEEADKIDSGESDIWSLFKNYVVLGDSRAVGFSFYHFLRDDRVLAGAGNTIRNINENMETLKAISPSYIYLCYGLNDTGIGFWNNGEEYGEELTKIFKQLKKELPDATIVASSILPATQEALAKNPVWNKIPDFDAALKEVCEKQGAIYVDNSELVAEYMDTLYDIDGVHLKPDFYPKWAKNLYIATIMEEIK